MGTTYSIKITALPDSVRVEQLKLDISALLKQTDHAMTVFSGSSEVSRFNQYSKSDWFSISPDILYLVNEANRISILSNGSFDITIGALVDLWGFGEKISNDSIPADDEIARLLKRVDYKKVEISHIPPAIRKADPKIMLNLSAIAKGFTVDKVAEFLLRKKVEHFLVEIGGEIRTNGVKDVDKPWVVAIERPDVKARSIHRVVLMKNNGMATSGDYRNYFEKNGKRYSHTIDPKTGKPVIHNMTSITVIHNSCMTADALATALMVLGPEKAYNLAVKENLAVFMILRTTGGLKEKMSPMFKHNIRSSTG